jgi:hypothetical protein
MRAIFIPWKESAFGRSPKNRAIAYGVVVAAILFFGCAWLLYLRIPPLSVLRVAAGATAALIVPFALFSLSGGEKKR